MTESPSPAARLVIGLVRAVAALPWTLSTALGGGLGYIAYLVAVRPRRIALINVGLCFPELAPRARRRLVRRHFIAIGQNALATARLWWAKPEEFARRVHVVERGAYDAARAAGRNIILLAPHFLALEMGGLELSRQGPCLSMYRAPKNAIAAALVERRRRFGAPLWRHDAPLRSLVQAVRKGTPFYYLPDLDPGDGAAVLAPFFGIPTPTLTALARLARLTDALVMPCFTRKLPGRGGFEVHIGPPLAPFPTDDPLADATRMNAAIEQGIRMMPEQYLWTYRRFKRLRRDGRSPYE